MKKFVTYFIVFVSVSLASADSYYSSIGLGTPHYIVSPKAVGMGGAGLSVVDPFSVNVQNPAAYNIGSITTVSVDMKYERIVNKLDDASIDTRQGNAAGFHFIVPLKPSLKLIIGFQPLTDSRYVLSEESATEHAAFSQKVSGSGGLNAAGLGLQYIVNKWIAVGGVVNFNFGSFNENWKTEFYEAGYEEISDNLNSYMWGGSYQLGVLLRPWGNLGIGVTYSSKSDLQVESQKELANAVLKDDESLNLYYPESFGFGVSYNIKSVLLAADFYQQAWNKYAIDGKNVSNLGDYTRMGGGLEYRESADPFTSYRRRVCYRIGAYMADLPFKGADGSVAKEKFITFGLGLPFLANRGRVDLSFEYGTRKSDDLVGYSENVSRFSGSITVGELWFQRKRK